jgi:hypothetical protein
MSANSKLAVVSFLFPNAGSLSTSLLIIVLSSCAGPRASPQLSIAHGTICTTSCPSGSCCAIVVPPPRRRRTTLSMSCHTGPFPCAFWCCGAFLSPFLMCRSTQSHHRPLWCHLPFARTSLLHRCAPPSQRRPCPV